MKSAIGVVGLGVMGKSLSRNLANNGFNISIYNRHLDGKEENVAIDFKQKHSELSHALPFDNIEAFVQSLEPPRKIILMVNAGAAVDAVLDRLSNVLEEGDIVIDGGNSHFQTTNQRIERMQSKGMHFIGAGVSGGEAGALKGPSIMPSGNKEAYDKVKPFLEAISAKDAQGKACCTYVGEQGSGHFVKMIHNGIEYVEMQLIAECYALLKAQDYSNEAIAKVFESWKTDTASYLLSITVEILRKKEGSEYVLDTILDQAANKGTGRWASTTIVDTGEPMTLIPAALFARYLSFFKKTRTLASELYTSPKHVLDLSIEQLKEAYQFSRIINHHQGFAIIKQVSTQNNWQVNLSEIARIWTEGCIIKSDFMKELVEYLKEDSPLLFNKHLIPKIKKTYASAQTIVLQGIENQVHLPCFIEALNFFNGIKTANISANMIQAQRDYFGAHTYQKIDDNSGKAYHTIW